MTKNKTLLLDIIRAAPRHMTAEQIFLAAKERCPGIAMATVYNNLGALAAAGEISRLHIVGQADRYDRNTAQHEHLVCDRCGCIADARFEGLLAEFSARAGVKLLSYELTMHYLCEACQNSQN